MKPYASALLAVLAASARGEPPDGRPGVPVLVELFTSEGCSSCPPAERVLSRLVAHPPDGVQVLALEEHVDYWDELGWRDRFAAPAFTRRQEAYVRRMRLAGPYTPQLVVGGRSQGLGGDESAARRSLSGAALVPHGVVELEVRREDPASLELDVRAEWTGGQGDVVLATVQDLARSDVTAGENAGRKLDHVAVARSLVVLGRGAGTFRQTVRVPRASDDGADRVVAFVQAPDAGPVLAAGTRTLPVSPRAAPPRPAHGGVTSQ